MNFSTYLEVKNIRDSLIKEESHNHFKLNQFHEEAMQNIVEIAVRKISEQYGSHPSPFSFFVMGSAGRFEQTIWSDQDHGIIYSEKSDKANIYFLRLGREISEGLFQAGYEYCNGRVMASNPLWCKSFSEWEQQLTDWFLESSWQSIRNLLIFVDGRSLYGEDWFIEQLKYYVYDSVQKEHLLPRILNNTMNLKKGIGVLGQFLTETHGPHTGLLNVKEKILFPYINAARLLAIKDRNLATSTLLRLDTDPNNDNKRFQNIFLRFLEFRLSFCKHSDYASGHYLVVNSLTNDQKKEIKDIVKNGQLLFQNVKKLVERGD